MFGTRNEYVFCSKHYMISGEPQVLGGHAFHLHLYSSLTLLG